MQGLPDISRMIEVKDKDEILLYLTSLTGEILSGEIDPTHYSVESCLCGDSVHHTMGIRTNISKPKETPKQKMEELVKAFGIKKAPTPDQGCGTYFAMLETNNE